MEPITITLVHRPAEADTWPAPARPDARQDYYARHRLARIAARREREEDPLRYALCIDCRGPYHGEECDCGHD